MIHSQDFTGGIYDKSERAFQIICLNRNATALNITLHSFLDAPILNPCFLIENWASIGNLRLKIDGQVVPNGANFKFGLEKIWIKLNTWLYGFERNQRLKYQ